MTDHDAVWRRPSDNGSEPAMEVIVPPSAAPARPEQRYDGPPRATPPPHGWRVPVHVQAAPPRQLPPQDTAAIDAAERSAQTFSTGLAILAGAVMVVALFVLLARALA